MFKTAENSRQLYTFAAQKLNTIRKTKYYVEDDFVYLG